MGNLTRQAQNPVAIRCRTARMRWLAEGQASKVERTATAPSYRPARRVDEAGRVARRHGTVAAQAPTSMTGRSGMGHEPRHAGGGTARSQARAARDGAKRRSTAENIKQAGTRGEPPDGTRSGTTAANIAPRHRDGNWQASRMNRRGGYHMNRLSASYHPVSNTR